MALSFHFTQLAYPLYPLHSVTLQESYTQNPQVQDTSWSYCCLGLFLIVKILLCNRACYVEFSGTPQRGAWLLSLALAQRYYSPVVFCVALWWTEPLAEVFYSILPSVTSYGKWLTALPLWIEPFWSALMSLLVSSVLTCLPQHPRAIKEWYNIHSTVLQTLKAGTFFRS